MIFFLTVICLCACGYSYFEFRKAKKQLVEYQLKVAKDFDIISKYLLKLPNLETFDSVTDQLFKELADLALRDEQIKLMIQDSKKELIDLFERERVELENIKANRSKDTFKSLRTALKATGKEQQDDD